MEKLKECPFCGDIPSDSFDMHEGYKWGSVLCGCGAMGPDVRTQYDQSENAKWRPDAIKEWNKRHITKKQPWTQATRLILMLGGLRRENN